MRDSRLPHLAIDARMIAHSGIGTYLRNILTGILASGSFRITLMGKRNLLDKFGFLDKADFIPLSSSIYHPIEQIELPLRIPRCDVFWSPHFNVPLMPIRARRRITTICDAYHLAHPEAFGPISRVYAKMLFRNAVRKAERLITISEFSRSEIIRYVGGSEKIHVIPCGVDPNFSKGYENKPINEDYILFVGNVKPHKNLRTLLRAYSQIIDEFPRLKLYIVGRTDGLLSPDSEVQSLIAALPQGRARLLGEVSLQDLKNYYANAKLFVFPSLYEGFGLPILEAMTFGLPIAASEAGPMREVGGDAVTYFDPLDAVDMARSMSNVLRTPTTERLTLYAERISQFSWNQSVADHMESIHEIASDSGRMK